MFKHLRVVKENSKDCARSDAYLISDHLFGFLNSFMFLFLFLLGKVNSFLKLIIYML